MLKEFLWTVQPGSSLCRSMIKIELNIGSSKIHKDFVKILWKSRKILQVQLLPGFGFGWFRFRRIPPGAWYLQPATQYGSHSPKENLKRSNMGVIRKTPTGSTWQPWKNEYNEKKSCSTSYDYTGTIYSRILSSLILMLDLAFTIMLAVEQKHRTNTRSNTNQQRSYSCECVHESWSWSWI